MYITQLDGTFRATVSNAVLLADKVSNSTTNKHGQKSVDTQTEWETIQALIASYENTFSDLYPSDKGLLSSGST